MGDGGDREKDEAAIREVLAEYARTWEQGDAEGWMALWDEEGVQLPYYEAMRVGKAAIAAANGAGIAANRQMEASLPLDPQEVRAFPGEGFAFARGLYSMAIKPRTAGAETTRYEGKFLSVFRKREGGAWKLYRDCFNLNGQG